MTNVLGYGLIIVGILGILTIPVKIDNIEACKTQNEALKAEITILQTRLIDSLMRQK